MTAAQPGVIFEDNHLLVVEKPPSMPVVPDASRDFSLLDWGKDYLRKTRNKPGNVFLAVIHRIDRPVSGLVCFAVTSKAASRLSEQMRGRRIRKEYLAISGRIPDRDSGTLKNYLIKDRRRNVVTSVAEGQSGARLAVTRWELKRQRGPFSLFGLKPVTGRSHQLRVHMSGLGCPIFGDVKYGSSERFLDGRGIALHSWKLTLLHPTKRQQMQFCSHPPELFPYSIFFCNTNVKSTNNIFNGTL